MYRYYSKTSKNRCSIVADLKDGELLFAASRCSSSDNFNRKIGRAIAQGRLDDNKIIARIKCDAKEAIKTFINYASELANRLAADPSLVNGKKHATHK